MLQPKAVADVAAKLVTSPFIALRRFVSTYGLASTLCAISCRNWPGVAAG